MQRPSWWYRRGPLAILLLPLGLIYAGLDALLRWFARPQRAPLPLICVGNLTVGGAGKTPVTQALARLLQQRGQAPAILSRGFGRTETAALRVQPQIHSAAQVGDEPLLHADLCPTYVGADRLETAALAAAGGATVLLLDDGLQYHRLVKDLALEVRTDEGWHGNDWPLPAGPLRQWFGLGTRSVDLTLVIGKDALPQVTIPQDADLSRPIAAFCGIADPAKFQTSLADLGLVPVWFRAFGDHHRFSKGELQELRQRAAGHTLITTQKDWVRLPADLQDRAHALAYAVRLVDPAGLWRDTLKPILA